MKNIVLRGFQSVRGLAHDSVTRLDKKMRIWLWKWEIWLSCIGLGISYGQRETFGNANIAQVDSRLRSNKSETRKIFHVKHLKMLWRLVLRPKPHWGSLRRSPDPLIGRGFAPSAFALGWFRHPLFVPTYRIVRPGSIILWPGYALVTTKVWRRHWFGRAFKLLHVAM